MRPGRLDPALMAALWSQKNKTDRIPSASEIPVSITSGVAGVDAGTMTVEEAFAGLEGWVQPLNAFLTDISNLPLPTVVNRLLYWNTATQTIEFLGIGTNLSISGGSLSASGGGGGGSGNSYFPTGW